MHERLYNQLVYFIPVVIYFRIIQLKVPPKQRSHLGSYLTCKSSSLFIIGALCSKKLVVRPGQSGELTTGLLFVHQHPTSENMRSCQSAPSVQLTNLLGCTGIILCNTNPFMNAFLNDVGNPSKNKTISFLIANRDLGVFLLFCIYHRT